MIKEQNQSWITTTDEVSLVKKQTTEISGSDLWSAAYPSKFEHQYKLIMFNYSWIILCPMATVWIIMCIKRCVLNGLFPLTMTRKQRKTSSEKIKASYLLEWIFFFHTAKMAGISRCFYLIYTGWNIDNEIWHWDISSTATTEFTWRKVAPATNTNWTTEQLHHNLGSLGESLRATGLSSTGLRSINTAGTLIYICSWNYAGLSDYRL